MFEWRVDDSQATATRGLAPAAKDEGPHRGPSNGFRRRGAV